jgi:xylose isomerase
MTRTGLKFDQDKSFGAVDCAGAFNQVRILDKYGYGNNGESVGLDIKVMAYPEAGQVHAAPQQQP